MDLAQLSQIGEFVGGIAVLVTLVYLAVQVRQGNEATRGETTRAFVRAWNEQVLAPLSDPVLGPLLRRANVGFTQLSGDEQLAAHGVWTRMVFLTHELYELDARGKVSDPLKKVGVRAVASYLKAPGLAEWWGGNYIQPYLEPDYREALERAMVSPDSPPPITDLIPFFSADRRAEGP